MKNIKELNLKNKKYIIFDMDGTLIDSIGIWNLSDYMLIKKTSGKSIDLDLIKKDRDEFLNNNSSKDIYLEYNDYLRKKYNINHTKEELMEIRKKISYYLQTEKIDFKPFVPELIKRLYDLGYTLIIATTTTKYDIDIYTRKNNNMINKLNLNDYFDLILTKEDVINKKPNPEIFNKIIEHYDGLKEEFIIIEDALQGILAAKNIGIEVINVYDKYSDKDRKKINELTDYKINSFNELIEILDKKLIKKKILS